MYIINNVYIQYLLNGLLINIYVYIYIYISFVSPSRRRRPYNVHIRIISPINSNHTIISH